MELIEKLGIDWKLLVAQIINFAILLVVLHRFVYRPVLKALQKRTETIEQSLKDAKQIENNLSVSETEKEALLAKARQQAREIITEATKTAEQTRVERLQTAAQEVEDIILRARSEINQAKETMLKEVKTEVADLVIAATERIIAKELDSTTQKKMVADTVAELETKRA